MTPEELRILGPELFPGLATWKWIPALATEIAMSKRQLYGYISPASKKSARPIPARVANRLQAAVRERELLAECAKLQKEIDRLRRKDIWLE